MAHHDLIPVSAIRNYVNGEPLVDCLEAHGSPRYLPDRADPSYLPECDFAAFIKRKGREFEAGILELLRQRLSIEPAGKSAALTLELMRQGVDAISHPVLVDEELGIVGIPDLLVRADRLNQLIPGSIDPHEAEASSSLGAFHYRSIDIKFSTIHLASGGEIGNNGSQEFFKAQLALYNLLLERAQGRDPGAAYLIGRSWRDKDSRITNALDRLLKVSFPQHMKRGQPRDWRSEALAAIEWIREVRKEGANWQVVPSPSRPELRASASNTDSGWRRAISEIAEAQEDLTILWKVGSEKRDLAARQGITRLSDPGLNASIFEFGERDSAILDRMIEVHRDPTSPVFPSVVHSGREQWGCPETLNFYVDFETVSGVNDDMSRLPERGGYPGIFMIGCGHEEEGEWRFECFVAERLELSAEHKMISDWQIHVQKVRDRLRPNAPYRFIHWSPAEVSQSETAHDSAYRRLNDLGLVNLPWMDMLAEVFRAEPIIVKGAHGFGLKSIAKALKNHGLIQSVWESGPTDGMGAMAGAWWCYEESQRRSLPVREVATSAGGRRLMREIEAYNEVDCRVMWEIHRLLMSTLDQEI